MPMKKPKTAPTKTPTKQRTPLLSLNLTEIASEVAEPEPQEGTQAPPSISTSADSSESQSQSSQSESPQPLPPRMTQTTPRGRPKGSKNKVTKSGLELRQLPENFESDPVLRGYRAMVRPLVGGVSKVLTSFETTPLDEEEKESGTIAFSALLYQYGANIDARVLVGLWLVSITLPRLAEYGQKRAAFKKAAQQTGYGEKSVTGEVVNIKTGGM